jgi:cardiolipin synthase
MKIRISVIASCIIFVLLTSCSTTQRLEEMSSQHLSVSQILEQEGITAVSSTYPTYWHNGQSWNTRSLELIESAQEYILISTFLGVEHPSTLPVWQALAKKAAEGVAVYIIIDSSSNFQMVPITNERIQAAYMYLRDLGLNVVEYNSLSLSNLFYIPKLLDRDHRKYWVVDGNTLVVGGININQSSLDWPVGIGSVDTMAELHSPGATQEVVDTFVATWNSYSPLRIDSNSFPVVQKLPISEEMTSLYLIDHYWPSHAVTSTIFDLFSIYAQQELWLIQGYTFLTPALLDRIRYAVDRGVAVNVMLSENATQPKYELASLHGVLDIIEAGATVYMYDSPEKAHLHGKFMIADQRLVTMGSINYNLRSQTLSRELNLLFEDEQVAHEVMHHVHALLEHCRVVTREEAQSFRSLRSWYNYLLMQVWG